VIWNEEFWSALDNLLGQSEIVIDRAKGTYHPRFPDMLYEVDYGYLSNTSSMDGGGIDVWKGSDLKQEIDAIMCIVDLMKRDSEIKILIGCTEEEKDKIYHLHNDSEYMKGVLIRRDNRCSN
jgi:inorganic pyrophosphatase